MKEMIKRLEQKMMKKYGEEKAKKIFERLENVLYLERKYASIRYYRALEALSAYAELPEPEKIETNFTTDWNWECRKTRKKEGWDTITNIGCDRTNAYSYYVYLCVKK